LPTPPFADRFTAAVLRTARVATGFAVAAFFFVFFAAFVVLRLVLVPDIFRAIRQLPLLSPALTLNDL
jgi:hypothetical protein